jgi:hypothetical protein
MQLYKNNEQFFMTNDIYIAIIRFRIGLLKLQILMSILMEFIMIYPPIN